MSDLCRAQDGMRRVLEPDHFNVESLGNQVPHLHWHIIPRYRSDPRWGLPIWMTAESELPRVALPAADRARLIKDLKSTFAVWRQHDMRGLFGIGFLVLGLFAAGEGILVGVYGIRSFWTSPPIQLPATSETSVFAIVFGTLIFIGGLGFLYLAGKVLLGKRTGNNDKKKEHAA
jgi:HIT domain